MNLKRIIGKLKSCILFFSGKARISYAQFGEDILVDYIFQHILHKKRITYMDIGTNDPVHGNNTYLFYLKGNSGVCIEPDPYLHKKILSKRTKDVVLNAGIGFGNEREGILYTFPHPYTGWNTFSKEEALKRHDESGIGFSESNKIPFLEVNEVLQKYYDPCPDFISVDVEGLDLEILKTIDFNRFQPYIFCVETISFSVDNKGYKNSGIIDFLLSKGYIVYADTYVNTIFIRKEILV